MSLPIERRRAAFTRPPARVWLRKHIAGALVRGYLDGWVPRWALALLLRRWVVRRGGVKADSAFLRREALKLFARKGLG